MTREEFRHAIEELIAGDDEGEGPVTKWAIVAERAAPDGRSLHLRTGGIDDEELTKWDALGLYGTAFADAEVQATGAFEPPDDPEE